jgi:predicted secreted Zn-dependent protease
MRVIAYVAFLACMAAQAAQAGVTQRTSYRPFIVHGKTAKAIYNSVVSHSRRKGKFRTYATTDVSLRPKLQLVVRPKCKVNDVIIDARFAIHLPQLANESALTASLRADWQDFANKLKRHEEHHRDIWLGCAADLVSTATGIAASDCNTFAREFKSRIKAANKSCRAKNEAFDEQAQGELPSIPFIRRALLGR